MEDRYESDNELNITPEYIIENAKDAEEQLLPPKSKERYDRCYRDFMKWKCEEKCKSFSERTLLAYFSYLSDVKEMKPSMLWSYFSMLKSELYLRVNEDVSKFHKVLAFIKRKNDGYVPIQAKTFTVEEMMKFINETPNTEYLDVKVVCIFGLYGACRTIEFTEILTHGVKKEGDVIVVEVPATKTKRSRQFVIDSQHCHLVDMYRKLRPQKTLTNRFFINYRGGKCLNQVIGKTKVGKMPRLIATFLELPEVERYTGHSFRRTSASVLVNTGKADLLRLKKHGDWKSDKTAQIYVDTSVPYKVKTANIIAGAIQADGHASSPTVNLEICKQHPEDDLIVPAQLNLDDWNDPDTDLVLSQVNLDDVQGGGILLQKNEDDDRNDTGVALSQRNGDTRSAVFTQVNHVNSLPNESRVSAQSNNRGVFSFMNCTGTINITYHAA